MNDIVERIAEAVLYEGYMLYPYRPSVKNRQRWTFGGLYPPAHCREEGADRSSHQVECLVQGGRDSVLAVTVRFLHLTDRRVGVLEQPTSSEDEPAFREVGSLQVGEQLVLPWQEAEARAIDVPPIRLADLPRRQTFMVPARRWFERLTEADGVLVREQRSLEGTIDIDATTVADGLWKVRVQVSNTADEDRTAVLGRTLLSAHTILRVEQGAFVSLLNPPAECQEAAGGCSNSGVWPVLVGEPGAKDTMLASPIILYDYPQVAAQSPGSLFDSTEIDEILTLRILTLTEHEKRQAAGIDERTRALLARTEALAPNECDRLHGVIRPVSS